MCGSVWAGGQCVWRDNSAGVEFGTVVRVVGTICMDFGTMCVVVLCH